MGTIFSKALQKNDAIDWSMVVDVKDDVLNMQISTEAAIDNKQKVRNERLI